MTYIKKRKTKIKNFFGNKCVICGGRKKLTVHHKFKDKSSLLRHLSLKDLEKDTCPYDVLCKKCHIALHRVENIFESYLDIMQKIKNKDLIGLNKNLIYYAESDINLAFQNITKKMLKKIISVFSSRNIKDYFLTENPKYKRYYDIFKKNSVI